MERRTRATTWLTLLSVLVLSCGTSSDTEETSSAPTSTAVPSTTTVAPQSSTTTAAPTTTEVIGVVIDQEFLAAQVEKSLKADVPGAVMVVVHDRNGDRAWSSAGEDPSGATPEPYDPIRVGSITKTFTSLAVLTLVEEGLVELDEPVSDYVRRVQIDPRVTVRDLLQHSSGLPDSTEIPGFTNMLEEDPTRAWSPEETLGLTADAGLVFEPTSKFAYSNNNYTVLGLLVEEVTGQPFHVALRERILEPLALSDTYLAHFEDGPEPYGGYSGATFGTTTVTEPIAFDFTSYATVSWAAGGLVSSARDLHTLMSAVFEGLIVSPAMVEEMTANPTDGLGIYAPEWTTETPLFGHDGRIAGAGTWLVHAPETGMTVFTMSNANYLFVSPATEDVAIAIAEPSTTIAPR